MPYYETVLIARQELSDAQVKDLTESYVQIIKDGGGKIHKIEDWGMRNLAYRIKKNRKGHYVLIESDTAPEALLEMERQMRLSDDVLRYMSLRRDELSTEASPIMDKDTGDRDDRRGPRGDRDDNRGDRNDKKEAA